MKFTRVIFVVPPLVEALWTFSYNEIYLGAAWIAAVLQEDGIRVEVIDCAVDCRSTRELGRRLSRAEPDWVAIPAIYGSVYNVYRIADIARQCTSARVVVGGLPATFAADRMMRECSSIDFCVSGEGEYVLRDLVRGSNPADTAGLVYRDGEDLVHTGQGPAIQDLETLPMPARHLFPLRRFRVTSVDNGAPLVSTTLETKRGCAFACEFCTQGPKEGTRYRLRSVDHVIAEIRHIRETHPFIGRIMIVDNDFLAPYRHGVGILEAIVEQGLHRHFEFMVATRVTNFMHRGDPLIDLFSRANVRLTYFGVESVNDKNRDRLGKIKKDADLRGLFQRMRERRLHSVGSYIFGFENETMEDIMTTLDASIRDDPSMMKYNILTPYPGTELFKDYDRRGLVDHSRPLWLYDNVHQVVRHSEDLEALFFQAYRRYFLRYGFFRRISLRGALQPGERLWLLNLVHYLGRRQAKGGLRDGLRSMRYHLGLTGGFLR